MKDIYLWFYCLPIVDAVLLVLLVTGLFLFLRGKFENRSWWRPAVACLLALWLVTVLWTTLESHVPCPPMCGLHWCRLHHMPLCCGVEI